MSHLRSPGQEGLNVRWSNCSWLRPLPPPPCPSLEQPHGQWEWAIKDRVNNDGSGWGRLTPGVKGQVTGHCEQLRPGSSCSEQNLDMRVGVRWTVWSRGGQIPSRYSTAWRGLRGLVPSSGRLQAVLTTELLWAAGGVWTFRFTDTQLGAYHKQVKPKRVYLNS